MIVLYAAVILSILNLFSFFLMGYDKRCAKQGSWRVPERRLFAAAICFGALGGVLGMRVFRHKTKHWYFKVFFPVLLVIQIAVIGLGIYCFGPIK